MYPYLTGSASWYLLTLITQVFGIRGYIGDLLVDPALDIAWLNDDGQVSVRTPFAGCLLQIIIHNPRRIVPSKYRPARIVHSGKTLQATRHGNGLLIPRHVIQALPGQGWQQLEIYLEEFP